MTENLPDKARKEAATRTQEVTDYLISEGYSVEEIYECQWKEECKANPDIQIFLKEHILLPLQNKKYLKRQRIIDGIMSGELFGLIYCDMNTPIILRCKYENDPETLEPVRCKLYKQPEHLQCQFAHFPPFFKNAEVTFKDIGEHMKSIADLLGWKLPKQTLISSYKAEGILLTTDLFKWYIHHGLEVEEIFEFIQFKPIAAFHSFGESVIDSRRRGDAGSKGSNDSLFSDLMKLIGNSSYGKFLMAIERFLKIFYGDEEKASQKVNDLSFQVFPLALSLPKI